MYNKKYIKKTGKYQKVVKKKVFRNKNGRILNNSVKSVIKNMSETKFKSVLFSNTSSWNANAWRVESYVVSPTIVTSTNFHQMFNIGRGTSKNDRIANKVNIVSYAMKFSVLNTSTLTGRYVRIVLW